MKEMQN